MTWVSQESFAFGEIDPSNRALVSSNQYKAGCAKLQNAIITRFGGARQRYGTGLVGTTYQNQDAVLFEYSSKGKDYVIEVSSSATAIDRVLRVWDAATRLVADVFVSGETHGPFTAIASTSRVQHHLLLSELQDIQVVPHLDRVYLIHKDHPPLFLKRETFAGVEQWDYDVAPIGDIPPVIVDSGNQTLITYTLGDQKLLSDTPIFQTDDISSVWRVMGRSVNQALNPYGNWVVVTEVKTNLECTALLIYGQIGSAEIHDPLDWIGPYKPALSGVTPLTFTATTAVGSVNSNDVIQFSAVATTPAINLNAFVGRVFRLTDGSYWIVQSIENGSTSSGVMTGIRLNGGFSVPAGAHNGAFFDLASRAHVTRQPVFPQRTVNAGGVSVVRLWQPLNGLVAWLPAGHENTFDSITAQSQVLSVGGSVIMNGGIAASLSLEDGGLNGFYYETLELDTLKHLGPSLHWGLGWSGGVGFPSCGVNHQGRLYFSGFEGNPSRVVASQTLLPESWISGPEDDDPLSFEVDDPAGGRVEWIESAQDLFVGTGKAEAKISGSPIKASEIGVDWQTGTGGANRNTLLASNFVLFVDADQRGIRQLGFVFDRDRYETPDLTDVSAHLFASEKIVKIASLVSPDSVIAALTEDGAILALSYRRENGVVGWSPWVQPTFPTATDTSTELSKIRSIAACRSCSATQNDELWMVREYTKDGKAGAGTTARTVEICSAEFELDMEDAFEGAISTTGALSSGDLVGQLSNLSDVAIIADGVELGEFASNASGDVTWGFVGYSEAPTVVRAGLNFRFHMRPLIPQFSLPGQGATQGRTKGISAVILYLVNSRGGTASGKQIGAKAVPQIPASTAIAAEDGWVPVFGVGEFGSLVDIDIIVDTSYPFELGGINSEIDYGTGL